MGMSDMIWFNPIWEGNVLTIPYHMPIYETLKDKCEIIEKRGKCIPHIEHVKDGLCVFYLKEDEKPELLDLSIFTEPFQRVLLSVSTLVDMADPPCILGQSMIGFTDKKWWWSEGYRPYYRIKAYPLLSVKGSHYCPRIQGSIRGEFLVPSSFLEV